MSVLTLGTSFACEVCEKTWEVTKKVYKAISDICTSMGYARAASVLAQQGLYKEAEYLMKYNVELMKKGKK